MFQDKVEMFVGINVCTFEVNTCSQAFSLLPNINTGNEKFIFLVTFTEIKFHAFKPQNLAK